MTLRRSLGLVGLLAALLPLVAAPVLLSQDGPAHVDGARVLLQTGDPGVVGAALAEHYRVDVGAVPNTLVTLALAGLMTVLAPGVAERVLVAGFVVALLLGARYALRGVDRRAGWLAVGVLPLAGGQLVGYGFWAFCWGVALSLWCLGVVLRQRAGWTPAGVLGLAVLSLATWASHLLPWLVVTTVAAALVVTRTVVAVRDGGGAAAVLRGLGPPALAVAPAVVLSALYAARSGADPTAVGGGPSWARTWSVLSLVRPLASVTLLEVLPAVAVAGTVAVLAVRALWTSVPPDVRTDRTVLAAAAGVVLAACLLGPERVGAEFGFLPDRLAWYPLLLGLLVAAGAPPPVHRVRAVGVLVAATVVGAVLRVPGEVADQRAVAEVLTAADQLPAGSTFAVLRVADDRPGPLPASFAGDPLQHVSGLLAVRSGSVDVGHYEAVTPYFQVRFTEPSLRTRLDPGLDGLERVPPAVDLAAVAGELDRVVLLGTDRAPVPAAVEALGTRVWTSSGGAVQVWRLHPAAAG